MFKKDTKRFYGMYRGLVLSNSDTDQLGRIKVMVYPMYKDIDTDNIPWAVPAMGLFEGAGASIGSFCVPRVNSFVYVFFEAGDYYQPVYFAEAQTKVSGLPSERTTSYPYRKVLKTTAGFLIYLDDSVKDLKIVHPNGSFIHLDDTPKIEAYNSVGSKIVLEPDGDIYAYAVKDLIVQADDNINMHANGHIHITADNDQGVVDPVKVEVTGNVDMNVSGYVDLDAQQNVDITGANNVNITSPGKTINVSGATVNIEGSGSVNINP